MSPNRSLRNAKNKSSSESHCLIRNRRHFFLAISSAFPSKHLLVHLHDQPPPPRQARHRTRDLSLCGMNWNSKDREPKDLIGKGWQERDGLPAPGQLKYAMVLRPGEYYSLIVSYTFSSLRNRTLSIDPLGHPSPFPIMSKSSAGVPFLFFR